MSRPHPTEGDSGVQQECANGTIMTLRLHGAIRQSFKARLIYYLRLKCTSARLDFNSFPRHTDWMMRASIYPRTVCWQNCNNPELCVKFLCLICCLSIPNCDYFLVVALSCLSKTS